MAKGNWTQVDKDSSGFSESELKARASIRKTNWKWLADNVQKATRGRWVVYSHEPTVVYLKRVNECVEGPEAITNERVFTHEIGMPDIISNYIKGIKKRQKREAEMFPFVAKRRSSGLDLAVGAINRVISQGMADGAKNERITTGE